MGGADCNHRYFMLFEPLILLPISVQLLGVTVTDDGSSTSSCLLITPITHTERAFGEVLVTNTEMSNNEESKTTFL